MGNSLTCLCTADSPKEDVLIMKANGGLIKCRNGVHVKEVLVGNPGFRIILCCSERLILPDSVELDSNRLYFLIPEELATCNSTYLEFWRIAESRGFIPKSCTPEANQRTASNYSTINGQVVLGQFFLFEASKLNKSPWKPGLQTIPEISPPHSNVYLMDSSPRDPHVSHW